MGKSPYRALAIEGGGMRGYYAANLLDAMCRLFNDDPSLDLGKKLDLICGTSTGAILACAIAKGIPLQKVMKMYEEEGKLIFPHPFPKSKWKKSLWLLRRCFTHSASEQHLKKNLEEYFGEQTLEELYKERKIALCIPSVNASDYRAWVFKTPHEEKLKRDKKYRLVDACMASAAAPLFFPSHTVINPNNPKNRQHFVDGGIWANSPILAALTEALGLANPEQDIHILSVGTVPTPNGDPNISKKSHWGIAQWANEITEMTISAQSYGYYGMATIIAKALSKQGRKVKVMKLEEKPKSPNHYNAVGIDRADKQAIEAMGEMAETDASENHSQITTLGQNIEIRDFFTLTSEKENEQTKRHQ